MKCMEQNKQKPEEKNRNKLTYKNTNLQIYIHYTMVCILSLVSVVSDHTYPICDSEVLNFITLPT